MPLSGRPEQQHAPGATVRVRGEAGGRVCTPGRCDRYPMLTSMQA